MHRKALQVSDQRHQVGVENKITHCQFDSRHEMGIWTIVINDTVRNFLLSLEKDINVTATIIKLYMRDCNLYSQFIACNIHLDLLES